MILCCGEALIDMIPTSGDTGTVSFTPHPGGAVFNTAIALGRLRTHTWFLSGLSSDLFGDQLRHALAGSNVDATLAIMSDRPTTLGFVQLTDGHATYCFYDENTAGRMLEPSQIPNIPKDVSTLYFGGISLISEPCAEFYLALAERHSHKRVVMMDPNIRANFLTDEDRYRRRLGKMIACTDILKVSDEDLNWIIPGQLTLYEKAAQIRETGPEIVVLTRGSDGASALFGDDTIIEVPAQLVEVVDTVGAGDTFNAGVLSKLSELGLLKKDALPNIASSDIRAALEHGARVASVTVSRAGCNPPWAHELALAGAGLTEAE